MIITRLSIILVFSIALCAQTKVGLKDVKPAANAPSIFYVVGSPGGPSSFVSLVIRSGCLIIDQTVTPPTLDVSASCLAGGTDGRDDYIVAAGQTTFASSLVPLGMVDVYRNGLIQTSGTGGDYTSTTDPTSRIVTVTISAALLTAGDKVTLRYKR